MERRLAAVLAADIVGFSGLVENDEVGTIDAVRNWRSTVLEPLASQLKGRIFKHLGDGVLIEFNSAVNAVNFAIAMHRAMSEGNASSQVLPKLVARAGLNVGDVIVDGDDLFGEGVNIAARLESLAQPGGILISQSAHAQVRGKVTTAFEDLGEKSLKNIQQPLRVFAVRTGLEVGIPEVVRSSPATSDRLVFAILPFANMSGSSEQDYFAEGLTEDLMMAMSKFGHLQIAIRLASRPTNGTSNPMAVGQELHARYLLDGNVRRSADRVRVSAQLIDCASGERIWSERFDRNLNDIFAVQDEIVSSIAAQLSWKLTDAAVRGGRSLSPASLSAHDYFLRARALFRRNASTEARDNLIKAIDLDPRHSGANANLAFFYSEDMFMQLSGEPVHELALLAESYMRRAVELNENDPFTYALVGNALLGLGRHTEAEQNLRSALALNPYNAHTIMDLGLVIGYAGRHDDGLSMINQVFQVEPLLPPVLRANRFWIRCAMGDADAAIADFTLLDMPLAYHHLTLAICLAEAGRSDLASHHRGEFEAKRASWYDVAGYARAYSAVLAAAPDRERFTAGLRALDFPVSVGKFC
ncbi:hypothetical protein FJ938_28825 [Mesorhizobium sp. B2-4-14]|uniref:adenylate/guanylate cyclase domain-containing protein n=1 Tax=Mesorhizobium sp. B2-4-14 TaxID=2589935 RepID=UPI001126A21A|nr:adenylate/guanylate cyclase domain-containing protein [Mesorhizobium sp. B2-4-14]TPK94196.1 hypothetical protein FJ938_28825 [Mesorhizobium sp. B2-4-14]